MSGANVCWVLTTGEAGMRSQALGLAEETRLPVVEKRVAVRRPWPWLPGGLLPMPLSMLTPQSDLLEPPWPRVVVACGRRSIDPALAVKRLSGGRTIAAYVQNPERGRDKFDLVAAMPHDGVKGDNVVVGQTALHHVSEAQLAAARDEWRPRLAPDGAPLLGVLVGGDNGGYRLTAEIAEKLVRVLRAAHVGHGMWVAATPSRRTPPAVRKTLATALATNAHGTFWNEHGENPYLGILALSDRLIVTAESISMISEALSAGRPVHVLRLEGHGKRHDRFLREIIDDGLVSPIEGDDLDWDFAGKSPMRATAEPGARLRALLSAQAR